jgi:hypothetical protein
MVEVARAVAAGVPNCQMVALRVVLVTQREPIGNQSHHCEEVGHPGDRMRRVMVRLHSEVRVVKAVLGPLHFLTSVAIPPPGGKRLRRGK